jgi:hypothetical protein
MSLLFAMHTSTMETGVAREGSRLWPPSESRCSLIRLLSLRVIVKVEIRVLEMLRLSWSPRSSVSHPYPTWSSTTSLPFSFFQYTTTNVRKQSPQSLQSKPFKLRTTTETQCVLESTTRLRPPPSRPPPATNLTLVPSSCPPFAARLAPTAPLPACPSRLLSVPLAVRPFASSKKLTLPVTISTSLVTYVPCALYELS